MRPGDLVMSWGGWTLTLYAHPDFILPPAPTAEEVREKAQRVGLLKPGTIATIVAAKDTKYGVHVLVMATGCLGWCSARDVERLWT